MRKLFVFIIVICLHCGASSSPVNDLVTNIAADIAKHNIYESATVGFAATPSTQNMRLNQLIRIANDNQLISLTKHKNAVVRLYALRAIIARKLILSTELKDQFNNDSSIVATLQGCLGNKSSVAIISNMIFIESKNS